MATNRDIDYVAKDFDSIVDALITFATVNFGPDTAANRQWTSFNVDDFSRTWLELVAYVGDLIFFYLDVQATQSNLQTATIRSAVLNIAGQFGFVVATASSASGVAQFTLNQAGTIPVGFRLAAENGAEFFVSSNSPAVGSTTLVPLLATIQGIERRETLVAVGVQNEEFILSFSPIVVDSTNPISTLISPRITVNGNSYTLVDTFIRSVPTDKHFRLLSNAEGQSVIRFGDGVFATQISPNDSVVINYRTGGGTVGNIPANTLTTLSDTSDIINSVTNTDAFSGGADESSIDQLRELIPDSLITLERAVTISDYGDIITANFSGISKAVAEENITDAGTDVNIYAIPSGNTITNITDNLPLFNAIFDFIDERKTVTTVFTILDAFPIDIKIGVTAFLSSGASKSLVESNLNSAFTDFFNLNTGDNDGAGTKFGQVILLNDIYDLVDQLEGIDRFEVTRLHYVPRIVDQTATGTNYLVSSVEVFPDSIQGEWLIGPDESVTSPEYIPYSVFRKIKGGVTNLNEDSLSDDTLNFAAAESSATGVNVEGSVNVIFDSSRAFLVDEYVGGASSVTLTNVSGDTWDHSGATFEPRVGDRIVQSGNTSRVTNIVDSDTFVLSTGQPSALSNGAATLKRDEFLFVDSAENVWSIDDNDAHSITLSAVAINNTIVSDVVGGNYSIVRSLIGQNILFHDLIFSGIEYNTKTAVFRTNSSFNLVGTIGDPFQISAPQINKGNFGVPITLDLFQSNTPNAGLGRVHTAGNPDLSGVTVGPSSNYVLIDSDLNVFEVITVDNLNKTVDILHDAVITPAPIIGITGGKPGSLCLRYYSDRAEVSFVIGLANKESGLGFQAIGNIAIATTVTGADISDGTLLTLNDGTNPATTFEFNKVGGVAGGNVEITFTDGDDAATLRAAITAAVQGAAGLAISASDGTGLSGTDEVVFLQNDNIGSSGNQAIVDTISVSGITINGMAGGLGAGHGIPTPIIPVSGESVNDFGISSDGTTVDHFEFRASGFVDDIVNLRNSEIPQIDEDNILLDFRGGVT